MTLFFVSAAGALALVCATASLPALAQDYRLAAGDVLSVTVVDEPSLSLPEARLQPGGTVMLPALGTIKLDGLTPDEARARIAAGLKAEPGLTRPDVLVQIVAYRPVFITGDVTDPGGYEYVPGMTVLQALSLAGGFVRPEIGDTTARLEKGRLVQALGQYRQQLAQSLVRRARLLAERDGMVLATPDAAAALVDPARLAELVAGEVALMDERKRALDGEIAILESVQAELDVEVQSLRAQYDARDKQSALIREEAAKVQELAARDLVTLQRSLSVQSAAIQADADKLEILAFISRAQTNWQKAEQEKQNLKSDLALDILSGLKAEDDSVAQLQGLIATTMDQMTVVDRLAGGLGLLQLSATQTMAGQGGAEGITILRGGVVVAASLLDPVSPDDVVFVPYQGVSAPPASP